MALESGSKGEYVIALQNALNDWGGFDLEVDGIFGAATTAAVREFQRRSDLDVDGIVGPLTWGALFDEDEEYPFDEEEEGEDDEDEDDEDEDDEDEDDEDEDDEDEDDEDEDDEDEDDGDEEG